MSLHANGMCLSLRRINATPTENKEGEDREKKTDKERKTRRDRLAVRDSMKYKASGVINATFHSLIQPPPTL